MKWFEGSINEAVTTSKSKRAIFVVFVEGKDDASQALSQTIESKLISKQLEQDYFVAIKLESGSESYKFFAQIYQLVPVPSIFFIGDNGLPLEVIANSITAENLLSKIREILGKSGKVHEQSASFILQEQKRSDSEQPSQSNVSSGIVEDGKSSAEQMKESASSSNQVAATSAEKKEPEQLDLESKLEKARQLIELQGQKRLDEEKEKEKEREVQRRKMGRDAQKMKQALHDAEINQLLEDRKKEKAADAAARDRVRQQIEQDKLERRQKNASYQQQLMEQRDASKAQVLASDKQSNTTRIQFKVLSGVTHTAQFESTSSLSFLRNYVTTNIQLPFSNFTMCASYPRKDLTIEDDEKSLKDLELVPTAVIFILPQKNAGTPSSVLRAQDNILVRVFWTILAPAYSVYNYVVGWIFGRPPQGPEGMRSNNYERPNPESDIPSNAHDENQTRARLRRNVEGSGSKTIKAQGNIHRLHSAGDEDDDNNTWNGNSTQQM